MGWREQATHYQHIWSTPQSFASSSCSGRHNFPQKEIHVYVAGGELMTDHSFYLAGRRFLTLRYQIERLPAEAA